VFTNPNIWRAVTLGAIAALLAAPAAAQAAAKPEAARLGDRILDPAARGNVTFENTANVASYQQDGVFTYRGWQYTAWYRGNRRAVISRRKLPNGAWQSTELDYDLFSDDSHNTIAMAVTPSDGRIHLAFPTHADAVRYTRSVAGVADRPEDVDWSSTLFERTRSSLPGAPDAPVTYTYPQFEMVHGRMLLTWRDGGSDNGRQALLRYDDNDAGTWTFLGRFTSNAGTYTSAYGSSTSRYGYLHGFTANPVNGDLEIAFTWRERGSAWCGPDGVGNHDLGYAVSRDGGMTWHNDDGARIGATGTEDLISLDDPHVVVEQPIDRGLINQEAQAFDSRGRLHVMTSSVPERDLDLLGGCVTDFYPQRAALARPSHHWRDRQGNWHTMELPTRSNSSGRTKLAFDRHDNAYVVLPDARIMAATERGGWRDWRLVFAAADVDNVSELIIDRGRLERDGVLTVAYQEPGEPRNAPSAFRIADFRLGTGQPDRPKATMPEAPPAAFEGTADDVGNLALNRTGTGFPAAFADDHQPAFPPALANDGNLSTFWVSAGTQAGQGPTPEHPVHAGVDLGEPMSFDEVTMIPRPAFGPRAYTVEVTADGASWTQVASVPDAPDGEVTSSFAPVTARHVRLRMTAGWDRIQPPRNVQIAELEVRSGESSELRASR
jgi:putative BNR repeat neuraminidase/F5/8 type C domain-containing protein